MSTFLRLALKNYMPLNSLPAALAIRFIQQFPVIHCYLSEKKKKQNKTDHLWSS